MTAKEAETICKSAQKKKLSFRRRTKSEDQFAVSFGEQSEFEFSRFTAAVTFLLAFAIEQEQLS